MRRPSQRADPCADCADCIPGMRSPVSVLDATRRITITRLGERVWIAGAPLLRSAGATQTQCRRRPSRNRRSRCLDRPRTGGSRAPRAFARRWSGEIWCCCHMVLLSLDGLPLVGATAHPRVFVDCAHSPVAWALSHRSVTVIADLVSGEPPALPAASLAAPSPGRLAG